MHEISLIKNIIEIVMAEMPEHNITRIETITLRIGEMRQVVPGALLFGFDILSSGTSLEGAKIIIENVPIAGHCNKCGQNFVIENEWFSHCPECKKSDYDIISGKELEIVEFEGS